jgi:hypothetical protein
MKPNTRLPDTCRSPPTGSGREYALAVAAAAAGSIAHTYVGLYSLSACDFGGTHVKDIVFQTDNPLLGPDDMYDDWRSSAGDGLQPAKTGNSRSQIAPPVCSHRYATDLGFSRRSPIADV